ncbi:glycerol-3-phosphate dehydrogenase C-terminal domain-containing protein [Billgrantia tianxiuensis]|uniref:glycerol-3-phosphate dehydrogenase C-terminal domain-containing protein n=2 Tax=Halomonadaceae TaxID=28256 RepID=UPI0030EB15D2
MARLLHDYPWLGEARARRFARSYGSLCLRFLEGAKGPEDLGEEFGAGFTAAEADHLFDHEWALEVEDILWRRTKLGLRLTPRQVERLNAHVEAHRQVLAA